MEEEKKNRFMPPLDITSLLVPFYTQALVKLGEINDPLSGKSELDLEYARRLIDLIDLFKEKTKGNLTEEEETFLNSILYKLKSTFFEKSR
jgi:hypothetical protein